MKTKKANWIIIILSAVILIGCTSFIDSPSKMFRALRGANLTWLMCAGICMIAYWIFEGMTLHILCGDLNNRLSFKDSFRISMIGQLFNCITPFASGGQPVQAYGMVKMGIPLGEASCILLAKFIVYQVMLTLYSLVVIIFRLSYFTEHVSGFTYLAMLGFGVNVFVVLLLLSIGFLHKPTKAFLLFLAHLFARIKIIANEYKAEEKIEKELNNFYHDFQAIRSHLGVLLKPAFIVILQLTSFFLIPYFLCLSFAIKVNILSIICAGAFVLMISSFVPLPGGSGGAEGGFYLFFHMFFAQSGVIGLVILLWRMITFYLPIVAGMVFAGRKFHFSHKKDVPKKEGTP